MALKRQIGLAGLTFIGVGGVLGSGWLFAPMLAAQHAGPAAILAWVIGGLAILLVALPFAEVSGTLPEAGAIARVPHYSHGGAVSMIIGWSAWVGYATLAPVETVAMLRYLAPLLPELLPVTDDSGLSLDTPSAFMIALAVLALMVGINVLGVAWFEKANSTVTVIKLIVPVLIGIVLISSTFSVDDFTEHGGFAPYGAAGVFSAVSAGGVVFALIGFRHVIDLAGEARRPEIDVPAALLLSIVICILVYLILQIAFIGGVPAQAVSGGWAKLHFGNHLGPLAGIAAVAGLSWLVSVLYVGAVLGPFGSGLIATGSNARLGMALARNGFFPSLLERLSARGVPTTALWLGLAAGALMLAFLPFSEMVALNSSAVVLSLCIGPLAMLVLRRQLPDRPRPVRVPAGEVIAPLGFVVAALVIYWSGWDTLWRLGLALLVGIAIFAAKLRLEPAESPPEWTSARWLGAFVLGIGLLSYLGRYGGGRDILPFGWDMAAVAAWALVCFRLGLRDALEPEHTQELVEASVAGP